MDPLNNEKMNDQLMALTRRVYNLEQEVLELKRQANLGQAPSATSVPNMTVPNTPASNMTAANTPVSNMTAPNTPAPNTQALNTPAADYSKIYETKTLNQPANKPITPKTSKTNKTNKSNKTMESKIGKNFMGVLAALLILVSFVLFAVFTFTFLPDVLKLLILYAISVAAAGVGIWRMKKDSPFNALFMTLAGIGVSGFYVVSLIGSFAFGIFDEFALLGIIAAWLVVTIVISRVKSRMFMYISNVGLIVSSILLFVEWPEILLGVVLYYVVAGILYFLNKSESYLKDMFWTAQMLIMSVIFAFCYIDNLAALIIIACLSTAIIVAQMFLYNFEKKFTGYEIMSAFAMIILLGISIRLNDMIGIGGSVIMSGLILAATIVGYIKFSTHNKANYLVPFYAFAVSILILNSGVMEQNVGIIIYAAAFLVAGFILKNNHFKYSGYALLLAFMFEKPELMNQWVFISLTALALAGFIVMTVVSYKRADKYLATVLLYAWIGSVSGLLNFGTITNMVLFMIVAIGMNLKFYRINPITKAEEKSSLIIGYVFNAIGIILGIIGICNRDFGGLGVEGAYLDSVLTLIIVIAVTLIAAIVNIPRHMSDTKHEILFGVYTCFKLTILLIVSLYRFDIVPMVISIIALLVAIGCIVLGFILKHKSFRIYGLVLTIVYVMKLCIIDISYDSDIMRPIGFFVAGVLCFAISFIYAKLEKATFGQKENDQNEVNELNEVNE